MIRVSDAGYGGGVSPNRYTILSLVRGKGVTLFESCHLPKVEAIFTNGPPLHECWDYPRFKCATRCQEIRRSPLKLSFQTA
jgi:hypothetical protein